MSRDPCFIPASELSRRIRRGEMSVESVVRAHLNNIHQRNEDVKAYIDIFEDAALEAAHEADLAVERGSELGPLHGVPLAVKDNFPVSGQAYTMGSAALAGNIASTNSPAVQQLKEAGAIVIGKTNLPEFGSKGITDNDLFGPTATPFDTDRTAGGSSGGSAVAAAAGMATLGLGTDGGGSLRIPASACGVFGMKPTFGRAAFSNRPYGFGNHTPMISPGPQTRTVEGGAMLLEAIRGVHKTDPYSVGERDTNLVAASQQSIAELDVGYTVDLGGLFPIDDRVKSVFFEAIETFKSSPASFEQASPTFSQNRTEMYECWEVGFQVRIAEAVKEICENKAEPRSEVLPLFDEMNVDAFQRIEKMNVLEYRELDKMRAEIFEAIQSYFEDFDLLVLPTLTVPPFKHGDSTPQPVNGEPMTSTLEWALTWVFNLTGHPVASVPAGFTNGGLPVGMQIVGPRFGDERVLAASETFERMQPWHGSYSPHD